MSPAIERTSPELQHQGYPGTAPSDVHGKIRVAVVDDHTGFRDMLAGVLEQSGRIQIAGRGDSAAEALRLAVQLAPDIMLLDINLPGDGLSAARAIAAAGSRVVVAMLTASCEAQHLEAAIRAGARAYILKGLTGQELVNIIYRVYEGNNYVAPALTSYLTSELRDILGRPSAS